MVTETVSFRAMRKFVIIKEKKSEACVGVSLFHSQHSMDGQECFFVNHQTWKYRICETEVSHNATRF